MSLPPAVAAAKQEYGLVVREEIARVASAHAMGGAFDSKVADAAVAAISRAGAVFVAAIVREERRKGLASLQRELDALRAAHKAAISNPFAALADFSFPPTRRGGR